jgi:hypothetical protein
LGVSHVARAHVRSVRIGARAKVLARIGGAFVDVWALLEGEREGREGKGGEERRGEERRGEERRGEERRGEERRGEEREGKGGREQGKSLHPSFVPPSSSLHLLLSLYSPWHPGLKGAEPSSSKFPVYPGKHVQVLQLGLLGDSEHTEFSSHW